MENIEQVTTEKKITKISVPEGVMEAAVSAHKELKKRGANIKIDDLFSDLFEGLKDSYWEKQIEKLTPDDYLIELVKQNSDARARLLSEAKRLMDAINRGTPIVKKRRGRKPASEVNTKEV